MTISGTNRFSPPAPRRGSRRASPVPGREPLGPTPPPGRETPRRLDERTFWLLLAFGLAVVVGLIYGMWRIARSPSTSERAAPAEPALARVPGRAR